MKPILADFLSRALPWWISFSLAAFVFEGSGKNGFSLAGLFIIPFALDVSRGCSFVHAALPIQRQTLARAYWLWVVGIPVVITTAIAAFFCLCDRDDYVFAFPHLIATFLGALAIASAGFILTQWLLSQSVFANDSFYFVYVMAAGPAALTGMVFFSSQYLPPLGQRLFLGASIPLALFGFVRAEKLLLPREPRRSPRRFFHFASPWPPRVRPGVSRLRGVFFRLLGWSLYAAVAFAVLSKIFGRSDTSFMWLGFMSIIPVSEYLPLRQARLLPLSTRHLALVYVAASFYTFLVTGFFATLLQIAGLAILLPPHPLGLALWLIAAAACGISLELRFGLGRRMVAFMLIMAVAALAADSVPLPVALPCCALALTASYAFNVRALGSSAAYRATRGLRA